MDKDAYPLLLVLIRSRGSLELISVIEGKSTTSEVLLNLIQSHELFEQQRQRDAEEEIVREKREDLKKQQEDEYHRSLQADLAKEQARLDDERKQKDEKNANERLKKQRLVKFFFVNIFIYIFPIYLRNNNKNAQLVFQKNQVKQKKILHD
jgi:FAS-associated factor 2